MFSVVNDTEVLIDIEDDDASPSLHWMVWTFEYTVLQISELYIQETLLNQLEISWVGLPCDAATTLKETVYNSILIWM